MSDERELMPPSRLPAAVIVDRKTVYDAFVTLDVLLVETTVRGESVQLKREVHDHGAGASVLAYDVERRTGVLVRQVRPAVLAVGDDPVVAETIAGLLDDGEDPADAVKREAMEEAGVSLKNLILVGSPYTSPGAVTERIWLYLAEIDRDGENGEGGGVADEHEEIEVLELPLKMLAEASDRGQLRDMKTILLVETLRRRRPELFA
ncbi:NUDIX domain-containing protein [Chthonobacter albigriseus]|uniref:NUDIX domain-containing protein n=1 Tax=Chthonobacter albigriseus TaxID=1683161 RepID=UPI0015EE7840|nr:NUDIX domain-containing protein [Chthonobacter albigriseus]